MFWHDPRIRTFTGKLVNPFHLKSGDFCIEDGAHSLSLQCGFTGHTKIHWSTAQHSLLVAKLCSEPNKFTGLGHDLSETYVSDIASPYKKNWSMWFYRRREKKVQKFLSKEIGMIWPFPKEIHEKDKEARRLEQYVFMNGEPFNPFTSYEEVDWFRCLINSSMKEVEMAFIEIYNKLRPGGRSSIVNTN